MRKKAFIDIETTGLEPNKHEAWEVAVAIDDGPVDAYILPHSLAKADENSLEVNGYWERAHLGLQPQWGQSWDLHLRHILSGVTIVAANPSFDVDFLYRRWGTAPWHHRKLDVESMAYTVLGYRDMKGLATISEDLRELGYAIDDPDHSAMGDVTVLRQCYHGLLHFQGGFTRPISPE